MKKMCQLATGFVIVAISFYSQILRADIMEHTENITQDTLWSASDIHLVQSMLEVEVGANLTIEPGAIVKFTDQAALVISGGLIAQGTAEQRILFTSHQDSVGQDNTDTSISPAPGDWLGVVFQPTADVSNSVLSHFQIRYAGASFTSALTVASGMSVTQGVIENNAGNGIQVLEASPEFSDMIIKNNGVDGINISNLYSSQVVFIQNCEITDNLERGISNTSYQSGIELMNSRIANNQGFGLLLEEELSFLQNNTLSHNALGNVLSLNVLAKAENTVWEGQDSHSIQISGGYTEQDLVLGSEAFPFTEVTINRLVEVNEGHILTLLEDTQITLYAPIWVKGRLESLGTPTAPVTWSLVSQSNIHFNTNISTLLQSATPEGKFVHSQFRHSGFIYEPGIETIRAENSHLTLQHAEISKSKGVSLFLQQSQATIEDSKILEAAGDGLVLQASEATVTRSIIRGQQMNGITLTDNSVLTLADSSLYANDNHGIELDASSVLEAARLEVYANANLGIATEQPVTIDESWWGHPDGPSIIANNRGQRVSALVTATNHRQEGPAFVYQNLGNAQIYSHQLTQPLVSGEAVTSDSNQAMDSFVENRQGSITLAFKQLTPDQDYQLLLNTFGDGFEGLQGINYSVTTLEGELLSLLSGYPIVIPKAQIQDGQITLVINPDGFRTTQVNRFFLAPINDAIPSQSRIVIESPDNGAAVNRESVIQGTYTGSVAEIYFRITQQDADKTTLYVGTANLLPNDRWQIPLNRMSSSIQEPIDIQIMLLDQNRQMVFADNLSVFFDTQLPPTVTELTASYSAPEIYLSWNNPKDDKDTVTRQLQRRRSEASLTDLYTWQTIASLPLDQTSFIDDDIIEGFVYSYRIVSIDAANNSQESFNTYDIYVSGSEDTQAPEIETLSVTTGYLDDANALAKANWTMNFGGETAQSFHLQISQDGGTTWGDRPPWNNSETIVLTGEKSSYIFSNLAINQDYQMRIQARDEWNNASAWLNQAFDTRLTPKDALRLDGDLNTTLTLPKAVYVIENRFNVRYDGELIIAPGSVIKIDKLTSLSFDNAKLTAVGTAEEPIIFTSLTDDIGGDSDGVEATPQAGDRGEFTLFKTIAELAHVELRYADRVQIEITGGQVVLRDAYLHDGKFYGLIAGAIDPRNPEIDYERSWLHLVDSRIERHQRDGLLIRDFSNNDVLALQNNHITDNGIGLSLKNIDSFASIAQYIEEDAQPKTVIENNAFENHREQGVFMENCRTVERFHNNRIVASGLPSTVPLTFLTQNTYSSHPNDYLGLCGTTHASHFSLAPLSTSDGAAITTFLVEENMTLRGDLTIAPGLVVKFQNALVDVAGSLQVLGTEQNPVILTASDNHRVGAATPSHENAACDGGVLVVRGGGRISHAQVSHHRSCEAFQEFFESGALVLENGQLDLNHVDFNNNLRALTAYGGGLKARYVTAWGNKAAWAWKHLPYDNFAPFQTIEARYNQFYLNHRGVAVIQDNNLARSLTTSSESTQLASTDTRVPLDFQHNWYFQNTLSAISNVYSQHGFEWNLQQSWWGNRDGASPSYQRGDFEITPQAFIDNTIWEAANLFLEYEPFLTTPPLNYSLGWVREQAWAVTGDYPITVQQGAIQTSDNDIEGIPKAYLQSTEAVELLISDLPDDNHLELYVVTYGYAQNSYEFAIELQNGLRIHDIENVMTHNNQTHTVKIPLQAEWLEAGELAIRIRNTQSMNPDSTINVAAVMVMESKTIEPPPTLEQLTWLDFDSNGVFNAGDKVIFTFATSTRATTDSIADWFLIDNQAAFASTDSFVWNAQGTELTVMVSADSQLAPGDEISLQFLEDSVGNPVTGTAVLPITTRQIPQFEAVLWSDVNQSLNFDVGDTVTVTFSKAMDSGSIRNNTQDANEQLVLSDGGQWGDSNIIAWNANQTAITITLTAGANVLPGSVISASAYLRDKLGVAVSGEIRLPDITDPPPEVLSIDFDDVNGDGRLSLGDQYRFIFSETINTDLLVPNTDTVNRFFNPDEKTYGRLNSVSCHLQGTQCWVTITEGFTITGNETVRFDSLLTDQNGSPIANTGQLNLNDTIAPTLVSATANYLSPVDAVEDFVIRLQFSNTMDETSALALNLLSEGDVPDLAATGEWQSTEYENDTYVLPALILTEAMDRLLQLQVLQGQDTYGNLLAPISNALQWYVRPNPPRLLNDLIAAPTVNWTSLSHYPLQGERSVPTAIWINDEQVVALGNTSWETDVVVEAASPRTLRITQVNQSGIASRPLEWVLQQDAMAPAIQTVEPANNTYYQALSDLSLTFAESQSGIDLAASTFDVLKIVGETQETLPVVVNLDGSRLTLTPEMALTEGRYEWRVQLQDQVGNRSDLVTSIFTLDITPPIAPTLNNVPTLTNLSEIRLSGNKESASRVVINGNVASDYDATLWSEIIALQEGNNLVTLYAEDRALNRSETVTLTIVKDSIAPPAVPIRVTDNGDLTVTIDWQGYEELDVVRYFVYESESPFTDVDTINPVAIYEVPFNNRITRQGYAHQATYYFAVVAQDSAGNRLTSVNPEALEIKDTTPPAAVVASTITASATSVTFAWQLPDEPDLSHTDITFNGEVQRLALSQTTFTVDGLLEPTEVSLDIVVVDNAGNASATLTMEGVNWLPNPNITDMTPANNQLTLSWDAIATPSMEWLQYYRIYASTTAFADVSHLTPLKTVESISNSTTISGLDNNVIYYIAVVAVNKIEAFNPSVQVAEGTPQGDFDGPVLGPILWNGTPVNTISEISASGVFSITASDDTRVATVSFMLDDTLLADDVNGQDGYQAAWDIANSDDGTYQIKILANDVLGNQSVAQESVTLRIAPPPAPSITAPTSGWVTNQETVNLMGSSLPGLGIQIWRDSQILAETTSNAQGQFETRIALVEGDNRLTATAQNRSGQSEPSAVVVITRDTSLPQAPTLLQAQSQADGVIALSWQVLLDENTVGVQVYRSTTPEGNGQKITDSPLTGRSFDDIPPQDGLYYYMLRSVNALGTESEATPSVSAMADSLPPTAQVSYQAQDAFDAQRQVFGQGAVSVSLQVSEPLLAPPFLSLVPEGEQPITVELAAASETLYQGVAFIDQPGVNATTWAVFSARDNANNRGTQVIEGASIQVDTRAPQVVDFSITPDSPVRNTPDNPVILSMAFTLDEAVKDGVMPELQVVPVAAASLQDAEAGLPVDNLTSEDGIHWQAQVPLPAELGLDEAIGLTFSITTQDSLDNQATITPRATPFQVYQGELPPLSPPFALTGQSLPGGNIALNWSAVEGAAAYQLYRQTPNDSALVLWQTLDAVSLNWVDENLSEGEYRYAIASVRRANGQESVSALSDSILVQSDASAPTVPVNLTVELLPQGMYLTWQGSNEVAHYQVYRADATNIPSVEGLTPLIDKITGTEALDTAPTPQASGYVVVAVDAAGNQSLPSNTVYLNVELLPVRTIGLTQVDNEKPLLAWSHTSDRLQGFDVYIGDAETGIAVNATPQLETTYRDQGWDQQERVYTVVAVDTQGERSLARSITLPRLTLALEPGQVLKKNLMNALYLLVTNHSAQSLTQTRLVLQIAGQDYLSALVDLPPATGHIAEPTRVALVVPGLPDFAELQAAQIVLRQDKDNASLEVARSVELTVLPDTQTVDLETRDIIRGGQGEVRFHIDNAGSAVMEAWTAAQQGNADSPDIRLLVKDADGNVLAVSPYRQVTGEGVMTRASGQTVAAIAPGERFTSAWFPVDLPASAPDTVTFELVIGAFYSALGLPEQVTLPGLTTRQAQDLIQPAYSGEVRQVSPVRSFGDEVITVQGRAIENNQQDAQPVPFAALTLRLSQRGFQREFAINTDERGEFSWAYTPTANEVGEFEVSVTHPEVNDSQAQATFTLSRLAVSPSSITIQMPRGNTQTLRITGSRQDGLAYTEVSLVALSAETGETFENQAEPITGLSWQLPEAFVIDQDNPFEVSIPVAFGADIPDEGELLLAIFAQEAGDKPLAQIPLRFLASQAMPLMTWSPGLLETAVNPDTDGLMALTINNEGILPLLDVQFSLVNLDGSGVVPEWLSLASLPSLSTLEPQTSHTVQVRITPQATTPLGIYHYALRLQAANHPVREVPVIITMSESGEGGLQFKVADIYTATLDEQGLPIQGLENAQVKLQHQLLTDRIFDAPTDALGEAFLTALPVGDYQYWVSATNHQTVQGQIRVEPGRVKNQDIFLPYNLISLEWSVREIVIEDRYEINLSATFETDVPAAVVVMEPASITLPDMQPGDIFYGELQITNHGLIAADTLDFQLPGNDGYFDITFQETSLPQTLAAKSSMVLPYRVKMVAPLEPDDSDDSSGAGCFNYTSCTLCTSEFTCANGEQSSTTSQSCFVYQGQCRSGSSGGGGGGGGSYYGWGGSGSGGVVTVPEPLPDSQTPLLSCREIGKDCQSESDQAGGN